MKIAAVHALAELARETVPDSVTRAYGGAALRSGPSTSSPSRSTRASSAGVAPAVARAAIDSGVARKPITDWDTYTLALEKMMDPGRGLVRQIIDKAKSAPKRVVFPESHDERVIKAATVLAHEGIARPVLIGQRDQIERIAAASSLDLEGIEIIDPPHHPRFAHYAESFTRLMQRRGVTRPEAQRRMHGKTRFALMMLREGDVDSLVMGAAKPYAEAMKPALQLIGTEGKACGMYIILTRTRTLFFADTTCQIDPSAEDVAAMTLEVVERVKSFDIVPRVAMLSFANFGAVPHGDNRKMARATRCSVQRTESS
jgi:malate dehydrogenase (oxaloacetate-decarboxylating)(NADP+)